MMCSLTAHDPMSFTVGVGEGPRSSGLREGPQVKYGLGKGSEAFSLDLQWASQFVEFVVRLRGF